MRLADRDDLLRDKFWRSLRSEKLKLATMIHFNTCATFDILRQKVRAEEYEMKLGSAMQQQAIRTETTSNSDISDTKADMILERIAQLEKKVNKRQWWKWKNKQDEQDQNNEGNQNHNNGASQNQRQNQWQQQQQQQQQQLNRTEESTGQQQKQGLN